MPVHHLLQSEPWLRIHLWIVDGERDFHGVVVNAVITLFNVRVHAAWMGLLICPAILVETGRFYDEGVIICPSADRVAVISRIGRISFGSDVGRQLPSISPDLAPDPLVLQQLDHFGFDLLKLERSQFEKDAARKT